MYYNIIIVILAEIIFVNRIRGTLNMKNTISEEIYKKLNEAKNISTTYPDKSYQMSEEAYYMSKNNNLKVEEGNALIGMSLACRINSGINEMLDCLYKALEIFEAEHVPLGQIRSLNLVLELRLNTTKNTVMQMKKL